MTSPTTDPGGTFVTDEGVEVTVYPSRIVMIDASGNLTDDPALAVRGEVIQVRPDGTEIYTSFTSGPARSEYVP